MDFKANDAWSQGLTLNDLDPAPENPYSYVLTAIE